MFQRLLQREEYRRNQADGVVAAGSAHVRYVFLLAGIYVHIIFTGIFPDDLALVYVLTRHNVHGAPFLAVADTISAGLAVFKGYQAAAGTSGDGAFIIIITCIHMVHDAVAFGRGEELVAEADEPPCRDLELQAHVAGHLVHVHQLGLTGSQFFHHHAHKVLGHVNGQSFHGFHGVAVFILAQNDLGFANLQLKAFPAHGFN